MTKYVPFFVALMSLSFFCTETSGQALRLPGTTNLPCMTGRRLCTTDIQIKWNAPGVKGREGKIWGTDIAYFGTAVLGFGSNVSSPWRAGADESTTMSFSTDVSVNGNKLAAGNYGFFIELYPDSSILIFNSNTAGWGSYFYDKSKDVLRVITKQQKDQKTSKERLEFIFDKQTDRSVELALEWEYWRIPLTIEIDPVSATLANIQMQMSGAIGFDPPSLQTAANWCLNNNVNFDQALGWITSATDPSLGGVDNFNALSTKSGLLIKLGKKVEADQMMAQAMDNATSIELHQYGRQLLGQKKLAEAMAVFEKNYTKNKGAWPSNVGMMRGYAANGNLKKALEHAKLALAQAPDDINKKNLETSIKMLESGKALN
ncbi:MAG: DUF2911 domain-containing protein [Saprospiraceae bacterium]|nr:DUF2911 domain-containing protein [Saprospiraceae bacterium]